MEFLIITGMSGAGKTQVVNLCEDMDFYCVDNMPTALVRRFADLCLATKGRFERVALVLDVRASSDCAELTAVLDDLASLDCGLRVIFVEASTAILLRRYKVSRRPHPLEEPGGTLADAVRREQEIMKPLRERADHIFDTSNMPLPRLREMLYGLFSPDRKYFSVNVLSFGFKHGIPAESDLVFDVRCLPNPFYEEDLKPMNGTDKPVSDFVFRFENSQVFLEKLLDLLRFLLPLYAEEGRHVLNIAIGCTGGRHRSVAMACAVAEALDKQGAAVSLFHRDMDRSAP